MSDYLHCLRKNKKKHQKGAALPLVAICLFLLIALAAMAIDLGYLFVGRNELQNTADAAALAGARVLGKIYQGDDTLTPTVEPMTYADQQTYDCSNQLTFPAGTYGITGASNDCDFIIEQVKRTAGQNSAGGSDVAIRTEDIFIGTWNGTSLDIGTDQPDAVSATARRDSLTMPLTTFFANIFGTDSMNVSALATAALSGLGNAGPGELELPIGIPDTVFDRPPAEWCQTDIKFSPPTDTDTCGGFTDFEPDNSVTPGGVTDLIDGTTSSPPITAGLSEVNFNNGKFNIHLFDALLDAYQTKGYDVDASGNPRLDADGIPVAPGETAVGAGPAVPLTENNPYYDSNWDASDTSPQLRYTPCNPSGCSGPPRYKHIWETGVVIYDASAMNDPCLPNNLAKIVGFAYLQMKDVLTAPDKYVVGELLCDYVNDGDTRGGGGAFGVKGPIPGLVQ